MHSPARHVCSQLGRQLFPVVAFSVQPAAQEQTSGAMHWPSVQPLKRRYSVSNSPALRFETQSLTSCTPVDKLQRPPLPSPLAANRRLTQNQPDKHNDRAQRTCPSNRSHTDKPVHSDRPHSAHSHDGTCIAPVPCNHRCDNSACSWPNNNCRSRAVCSRHCSGNPALCRHHSHRLFARNVSMN